MRELSFEEVEDVSGGDQVTTGLALILGAITIAASAGVLTLGVGTAIAASPFVTAFSLGLAGTGGFQLGGGIPTVTIGPDFVGGGSARDSDC